ncbi:MAG: arylesterase [Acidobacteria bacterium]|nr:arylesterase [Acidobacteriota bacterium]
MPAIVAFGDSLTAGHGAGAEHPYPEILQQNLNRLGFHYHVINAGVSGDTTGSALARIDTILAMNPAYVILELGGNDGLRGLPLETTRANLEEMIIMLRHPGRTIVLAGMTLPPNYGRNYISAFELIYKDLAAKYKLPLIPFLLQGVGGSPKLMQVDGIHPNAEGNRIVADNVLHVIEPLLAGKQ